MAGNLLPIVLVGGAAFVVMSKKKKRKRSSGGLMIIKGDCTENHSVMHSSVESLMTGLRGVVMSTGKSLGVEDLGQPPGDAHRNSLFTRAWATAIFKKTVDPKCMENMGVDPNYGSDTNEFGPDFTNLEMWPGATGEWYGGLLGALEEALGDNGYDFGAKTVIVSHDERTADPFEKLVNWIKRER